jgi:broad specificity phosphatase PhoE
MSGRGDGTPRSDDAMTTLYLLRHGETTINDPDARDPGELIYAAAPDMPLTARGRMQAQRASERLSGRPLAAVYASTYRRAIETAEAIAAPQGLSVQVEESLIERDFGEWEGLSANQIAERHPLGIAAFDAADDFAPPGGETILQVRDRALPVISRIAAECARCSAHDAELAVIAHQGVTRVLLSHWLGLPPRRFRGIRQHNACINTIRVELGPGSSSGLWRVQCVNDTCHLAGLVPG